MPRVGVRLPAGAQTGRPRLAANRTINGNSGDDVLEGSPGNDRINAPGGRRDRTLGFQASPPPESGSARRPLRRLLPAME